MAYVNSSRRSCGDRRKSGPPVTDDSGGFGFGVKAFGIIHLQCSCGMVQETWFRSSSISFSYS
jgi:hypothetical protein